MGAFTSEQERTLKAWTRQYPYAVMGLLEALRQVQDWHHCVTDEDEEYLAELFQLTRARIHEVATFFPVFTRKPAGRYRIGVCRGLSCSLAGADKICDCLRAELGLREGETTSDGKWSFERTECLGACDHAPALIVNDELKGQASEQRVALLLEELK